VGHKSDDSDRSNGLGALLAGARPVGATLQDYCRACECIDWQLSRRYWEKQGPAAFLGGDVPYVVTNDGYLAGNALAVLLAGCEAAVADGTLEDEITVLELGAGSGLFAKQFLDQLRATDTPLARDVYQRLTYVVTDGSEGMIAAMQARGIFAEHGEHVRCLPARLPGIAEILNGAGLPGQVRAVFANYLLDSLPFTILSLAGSEVHELRLRTSIAEGVDLAQYTTLSEDEIITRFQNGSDLDLAGLSGLFPALVLDGRYDPVTRADLPLSETIPSGSDTARSYLHCYGALDCIDEMLGLLRPDGFMLVSDYGQANFDPDRLAPEFQHFGGSVAVGVNFGAVGRVFGMTGKGVVTVPDSDTEHLLSRLISRQPADQTKDTFRARYSKETWDQLTKPVSEAQGLVAAGQIEAARWKYQEALRLQPFNWAVLEEIAGFLCYHLEDYEAALNMARETLELNHISPGAWNIVGDCFFYTDNIAQAAEAFEKALGTNPKDVRAMLNLAWVAVQTDQPDKALGFIAKGLACDTAGAFRAALLGKQEQILARISGKHDNDMARALNRMRGHGNLPQKGG